jgi:hypothetical protein
MADEQAARDAALRHRLGLLKKRLQEDKIVFGDGLSVAESFKAVRTDATGEIDLDTVDSNIRALALAVQAVEDREDAKKAISLADLQQGYFDFVERNFGWLYKDMVEQGATPGQVASSIAAHPQAVKDIGGSIPGFNEWIAELWGSASDTAHYHVQDLRGLKAVFGGETFPQGNRNIVSSSGVYTDTIVLPDPFLRTQNLGFEVGSAEQVSWFVKAALSLLHYREAATAGLDVPLVVIVPDQTYLDQHEKEMLRTVSTPSALAHLEAMFGIAFGSLEEAGAYLTKFTASSEVIAQLKDPKRLVFDVDDQRPLEEQIENYMRGYVRRFHNTGAGEAVLLSAVGRMTQATDLLRRSTRLGGTPIIDAPTSWRYFAWRLDHDAQTLPSKDGRRLHLHMNKALQSAASGEMQWLGQVPVAALIEMRKNDVLPELRQMLSQGVEQLADLRPDNFYRTGDQVVENIQNAFDEHRKAIASLTGKKWRFAGIELASCVVKGVVQVASACGVPVVSVIGAALDQVVDIPKMKDVPKRIRTLKEEGDKLKSSAVGMLFNVSKQRVE